MPKEKDWSPHLSRLVGEQRNLSKTVDKSDQMSARPAPRGGDRVT